MVSVDALKGSMPAKAPDGYAKTFDGDQFIQSCFVVYGHFTTNLHEKASPPSPIQLFLGPFVGRCTLTCRGAALGFDLPNHSLMLLSHSAFY